MLKVGLLARLEAKSGKEKEVENFLEQGLELAMQEVETPVWFAIRLGPKTFGIFDAFSDETGRKNHLEGLIAKTLMSRAEELLAQPPVIEAVDVIGAKILK